MPLYEYYCSACQLKFELLVSHQHADEVVCMKCHSEKVRRLLSVFSKTRNTGSDISFDDTSSSDDGCCGGGACGCH
jgi:putative FmdB family regulatory protein